MTEHRFLDAVPHPVKLRVADFELLSRAGAFSTYAKTELIDGAIVTVNSQAAEHFTVKNRLYRRVADACDALGSGLEAWSEGTIAIPAHGAPEPDIFVTDRTPTTGFTDVATVRLVIEVSSTTLDFDAGAKLRLYASGGVPEYWIVDVAARHVSRFVRPQASGYEEEAPVSFGKPLAAVTVPGLTIATTGL